MHNACALVGARALGITDRDRRGISSFCRVPMDAQAFLDLLAAHQGLVAVVGAGGKKSTLHRLAEAHLALGHQPIGLTATVAMGWPPASLPAGRRVAPGAELAATIATLARRQPLLVYGQPPTKPGRLTGLPPAEVAHCHAIGGFVVTLVKADGARMRGIKAPAATEPVLPPGVTTILPIVSARVIGRPLDPRTAHRPERVALATGAALGETLTADHVGRLLASPDGALRGVGDATVVPIINMVDDQASRPAAQAAADRALAESDRFDRVVLTSMIAAEPVVEVVRR